MTGQDFYSALGLSRNATAEEIRGAYFEEARRYHPDVNADPQAAERFIEVQKAYETLSNPQKRAEYDALLPPPLIAEPEVNVSMLFSRPVVPRLPESQLLYVLMDLECGAEADPSKAPPTYLVIVADRSTSMQGERMDMMKANLNHLLHQLKPSDVFCVITFSDRAEVLIPPTRVKEMGNLDHRISLIQTNGGTEIYQGLRTGADQLLRMGGGDANRHLLLLTDGHTYGDETVCYDLVEAMSREGIVFSALGIGSEWNDAFLDHLTAISGGSTLFATSPKDLFSLLEQKLAVFGMVYARKLTFHFTMDPSVQLRYAFRLQPELGAVPISSVMRLGNLHYGRTLSLLFEFLVQPIHTEQEQLKIANGYIEMTLNSLEAQKTRLSVDLRRPIKEHFTQGLPPGAIIDAMARLTLYRMQEKARQEVASGDIIKATQRLQQMATHLLAQGDRELAHTVLVEAEHIQQSHRFSKDGDKRIKYGTRALLLPSGAELGK